MKVCLAGSAYFLISFFCFADFACRVAGANSSSASFNLVLLDLLSFLFMGSLEQESPSTSTPTFSTSYTKSTQSSPRTHPTKSSQDLKAGFLDTSSRQSPTEYGRVAATSGSTTWKVGSKVA